MFEMQKGKKNNHSKLYRSLVFKLFLTFFYPQPKDYLAEINECIIRDRLAALKTLLKKQAYLNAVVGSRPLVGKDGWTAVHLAAVKSPLGLKMLVKAGARVNAMAPINGLIGEGKCNSHFTLQHTFPF